MTRGVCIGVQDSADDFRPDRAHVGTQGKMQGKPPGSDAIVDVLPFSVQKRAPRVSPTNQTQQILSDAPTPSPYTNLRKYLPEGVHEAIPIDSGPRGGQLLHIGRKKCHVTENNSSRCRDTKHPPTPGWAQRRSWAGPKPKENGQKHKSKLPGLSSLTIWIRLLVHSSWV